MNRDVTIKVTNRSGGYLNYSLPELHISRVYSPNETKQITYGEIADLSMQPGGQTLIENFLLIQDDKAVREVLNKNEEPEYWLNEENLPQWLKECSLDEFRDGLHFAPTGVCDLIKKLAVEMPLNDNAKREAIQEILGFNVTGAIAINEESKEDNAAEKEQEATQRRARVTTASKYKVVSKQE